jgi:type I restriction-modification system DNA methylase subunit
MIVNLEDPYSWAETFGLAEAPFFGAGERDDAQQHRALLDSGFGSLVLSVGEGSEYTLTPEETGSWIWSADIPHHVGVTRDLVTVARWDDPSASRKFVRSSIEDKPQSFYRFLTLDRVERGRTIVDHTVELFRRVRTIVSHVDGPDEKSVDLFLLLLASLIEHDRVSDIGEAEALLDRFAIDTSALDLFKQLNRRTLDATVDWYKALHSPGRGTLRVFPALAVRHAGGLIFQEAHFDLLKAPSLDLFGEASAPDVGPPTRGSTHFTPPAVARAVVEQSLRQIALAERAGLIVVDPACGSGAFLHEVLRALGRWGYAGKLTIVGRDISPIAVSMAQFALRRAVEDCGIGSRCVLDIEHADSLSATEFPAADLIIMNPPFVSWGALTNAQRDEVQRVLGRLHSGRADYSMAFILRALNRLKEGGVLGTLFPASLLVAKSAEPWREHLLQTGEMRFLASLGDYGLFSYALVQVAALVLVKGQQAQPSDEVLTVWTGDEKAATGDALRALRSISARQTSIREEGDLWRVAFTPQASFRARSNWRLRPNKLEHILEELRETTQTRVSDLFSVQQGIRTGGNDVFLLSRESLNHLPRAERKYFRPAVTNRSIENGRVSIYEYVFYPYGPDRNLASEQELQERVPVYFKRYLLPHQPRLASRSYILRQASKRWWHLAEPRGWLVEPRAKVISKYFGGSGAFVADLEGNLAVVQGFGWVPTARLESGFDQLDDLDRESFTITFLSAYVALFNSSLFLALLAEHAPQVAGGQYDLSPRYVDAIPLPDLVQLSLNPRRGRAVAELEQLGRGGTNAGDPQRSRRTDDLVAQLYGIPYEVWLRA